jgi:MFS family permease
MARRALAECVPPRKATIMTNSTHDLGIAFGKSVLGPAEPARVPETSPRYAGWRVTFVCFLLAVFCWGFGFYGHGIYLAELRRLNGWPASLISAATTVYYLFSASLVVFVSDAIARLGLRTFVLAGIACLAVSIAAIGMVRTPWQLFAVYLLMSFGWATMSVGAITNILGLWFDRRRGLAISLALTGASASGIVIIPPLVLLVDRCGLTAAMIIASVVTLLVLVPITLLWIREPRSDASSSSHRPRAVDNTEAGRLARWTRPMALRSFRFWTVSAPFALALLAQVGFLVHQIAFLEPAIGRTLAGAAVALATATSIFGRLALGTVIDRLNQRLAAAVSLASQAAALLVMTQTTDPAALFAACAVFGFSIGNLITFPALIIQREFEAASFGMLIALSTAIGQFTYAFGPALLGVVHDRTGGYGAALALCVVLDLLAAATVLLQRPMAPR